MSWLILLGGGIVIVGCVCSVYLLARAGARETLTQTSVTSPAARVSVTWPTGRHLAVLALFFLAIAVYGSLVPLTFRPLSFDEALIRFRQIPYLDLGAGHRADWVSNILLFIPISFCAVGAVSLDRRLGLLTLCWPPLVILLCTATSVALEFTQLWFPPRTVSQNDIIAETIGAVAGAVLWILIGQTVMDWVRTYTASATQKSQLQWLLEAYVIGFFIYSVLPLDLTITPVELLQKLRAGRINLIPFADFGYDPQSVYKRLRDILLAIPIGILAATWLTKPEQVVRSMGNGVFLAFLVILLIESAQVFVFTRYASVTDIILGTIGSAVGVALVRRRKQGSLALTANLPARWPVWLWLLACGIYAFVLLLVFCLPFDPPADGQQIRSRYEGFYRVPFAALYWGSEFNAISEVLRKTMFFAPLGILMALAVISLRTSRQTSIMVAILLLVVAAGWGFLIEMVQVFYASHIPDITDVILYWIGAALGMIFTLRILRSPSGVWLAPGKSTAK